MTKSLNSKRKQINKKRLKTKTLIYMLLQKRLHKTSRKNIYRKCREKTLIKNAEKNH